MSAIDTSPAREPLRLLVVSSCVFPQRGGSAVIMENLARQFDHCEMTVIGELGLLRKPYRSRPDGGPEFHYFRSGLSLFGRGARFFSKIRWQGLPLLVRSICKLAKQQNSTHIMGVYPDELYCYAAYQAAIKLDLPFSTYFHNTYLDNAAINRTRASRIQHLLFERSCCVFVMSDGMKSFFDSEYTLKKCVPLVHTFEKFPAFRPAAECHASPEGKTRLVLFGNFNESNIEATTRFIAAVQDDSSYEISLYTHVPTMLLQKRGIPVGRIRRMGYVPESKLIDELQQYDVLVLTHGFKGGYGEIEYRTIFPTRTIPMLLAQKPIFLHSPPHAFLTSFFHRYGCGAIVDEASPAKICEALQQIRTQEPYRDRIVANAQNAAKQFHGPKVAETLRTHLLNSARNSVREPKY